MARDVDSLISEAPPADPRALERARSAFRAELGRKRPVRPWRSLAAAFAGATLGVVLLVGGALFALGQASVELLVPRLPVIGVMIAVAVLCAFASLSPRARLSRWGALALAFAAAALLVVFRLGSGTASALPEWVCTASHLGVGLVPLGVAIALLRGAAPGPLRAAVAGAGSGVAGALLGELACAQGWRHVAVFHLSAWALVTIAAVLISLKVKPTSYAP